METLEMIGVFLLCWGLLCLIVNLLVLIIFRPKHGAVFKIKLPKKHKYRNRKSPIYKLTSRWAVQKWELQYDNESDLVGLTTMFSWVFIPIFTFSLIPYCYVANPNRFQFLNDKGEAFEKSDLTKLTSVRHLGAFWEQEYDDAIKSNKLYDEKLDAEAKALNNINKEFNENYIE